MSSPSATAALKPLRRLALHSTTTCATHASAYGKCIVSKYEDVQKDMCKAEFEKFGRCMREAVCVFLALREASPSDESTAINCERR